MTKRVQLFTHGDLDGAAAAVMVYRGRNWGPEDVKYEICQYSGPSGIDEKVNEYLDVVEEGVVLSGFENHLVMTDIGPSKETCERIEKLKDQFASVSAYDHHKSTLWAASGGYDWYHHSGNSACGAKMAWEHVTDPSYQEDLEGLALATDAYDRWVLDSVNRKRGEDLNLLFKFLGFSKFVSEFTENPNKDLQETMEYIRDVLRDRQRRATQRTIELQFYNSVPDSFFTDKAGRKVALFISDNDYISQTAELTLKEFPDVDYVGAAIPATGIVSLRSRNNGVDVAAIAETFGGGGHPGAAGFPIANLRSAVLGSCAALLEPLSDE